MKELEKMKNINTSSDTSAKTKKEINNNTTEKAQDEECNNIVEENEDVINEESEESNAEAEETITDTNVSNEELMKQLRILNISMDNLYILLLGVSLNINFLKGEKAKLLDAINKTNLSEGLPDLSNTVRITSIMFLYVSGSFLDINYNAYKEVSSVKGKLRNLRAIRRAWRRYLASLLTFIGSAISRDSIEP